MRRILPSHKKNVKGTLSQVHQTRTHNKPESCRKAPVCGDIATKFGPAVESYTDTLNNLETKKRNLKISLINAQSIRQQRLQLKKTLDDLDPNIITALTETWLNYTNEKTLWQPSDHFQFLRSGRWKSFELKVGVVMLIVPALCSNKTRKDLAKSFKENQLEKYMDWISYQKSKKSHSWSYS